MKYTHFLLVMGLAAVGAGTGCGGDSTGPENGATAPVITIAGVEEGTEYPAAVTPVISVDRGSFEATLDGAPFVSGTSVSAPGPHTLVVVARNDGRTVSRTVRFSIAAPPGSHVLILRLIDLGVYGAAAQHAPGDAILVTDSSAAGMRHGLVDAGSGGTGIGSVQDFGYVADRLEALGVDTLEFVLLTHAHADHYSGLQEVLAGTKVKWFIYSGQVRSQTGYNNTLDQARGTRPGGRADSVTVLSGNAAVRTLRLGGSGGVQVSFLPALPTYLGTDTDDGDALNNGSVGAQVRLGDFEIFLTGDSEWEANQRWMSAGFASYSRDVDVLKVGHHGANNAIFDGGFSSGSSSWLAHTSPRIALISANGTTHPRQNALAAILARVPQETYCTNVHGTITVRADAAGDVRVTTQRNQASDCVAGSLADT